VKDLEVLYTNNEEEIDKQKIISDERATYLFDSMLDTTNENKDPGFFGDNFN